MCSRPNKVQDKTFIFPKTLLPIAMSLPEGIAISRIDFFFKSKENDKRRN